MEYLTLQDLPHRHFHPLHPQSMASDEHHRPHRGSDKGGLPALAAVCESQPFLPLLDPPTPLRLPLLYSFSTTHPWRSRYASTRIPSTSMDLDPSSISPKNLPIEPTIGPPHIHSLGLRPAHVDSSTQNHHMRNSPPFQPGEQRPTQNALPSFSQVRLGAR